MRNQRRILNCFCFYTLWTCLKKVGQKSRESVHLKYHFCLGQHHLGLQRSSSLCERLRSFTGRTQVRQHTYILYIHTREHASLEASLCWSLILLKLNILKPHIAEASLCWSLTLLNPYIGEASNWWSLTLVKPHIGEASHWWSLTLLMPHIAEASYCWSLTFLQPYMVGSLHCGWLTL